MNTFLMALGLALIIKNGVKLLWGNSYRGITAFYPCVTKVFGLSCSFAALAGGALLALTPAYPANGTGALHASWVVLILMGGSIVGILESFCIEYLGSAWQDVFTLTIVILILLINPNSILGKKGVKSAVE